MIALIDNYDSFTWNLAQQLGAFGTDVKVIRNDAITIDALEKLQPEVVVISPGPGTPEHAGVSIEAVERLSGKVPILGVCLGHQAIAAAFGGRVGPAPEVMHGKVSRVFHEGIGIFEGIPSPFEATRYHSLMVEREGLPESFQIVAWTGDREHGVIQGIRHRRHETWGVQFHPESLSTRFGATLLRNLLQRAEAT